MEVVVVAPAVPVAGRAVELAEVQEEAAQAVAELAVAKLAAQVAELAEVQEEVVLVVAAGAELVVVAQAGAAEAAGAAAESVMPQYGISA